MNTVVSAAALCVRDVDSNSITKLSGLWIEYVAHKEPKEWSGWGDYFELVLLCSCAFAVCFKRCQDAIAYNQ